MLNINYKKSGLRTEVQNIGKQGLKAKLGQTHLGEPQMTFTKYQTLKQKIGSVREILRCRNELFKSITKPPKSWEDSFKATAAFFLL